jgi:hypothetical protein
MEMPGKSRKLNPGPMTHHRNKEVLRSSPAQWRLVHGADHPLLDDRCAMPSCDKIPRPRQSVDGFPDFFASDRPSARR